MTRQGTIPSKREIAPLTGIRGVAAFMVMLYHLDYIPRFATNYLSFAHKGYLSVDLFYVLSGFVLALRYREWFAAGVGPARVGAFLLQRLGRIYPAYFIVSAFYYVKWLVNLTGHRVIEFRAYDVVANILLLQGWGVGASAICGTSGSVSAEMFAYLLFPLLVGCVTARASWRSALLAAAATLGVLCVAFSPYGVKGALDVVNDETSFLPLLRCISEFSLGLVAFELSRNDLCKRILSGAWAVPVLLAGMAGLLGFSVPDAVFALAIPFLIIGLSYEGQGASLLFGNKLVHKLGVISYSLYLLHPAFRDVAGRLMEMTNARYGAPSPVPFILLAVAGAIIAAYAFQRLVEVPGRRLANRLARRFFPTSPVVTPAHEKI
jgi:peptidoglycan/LPS O-acetylase OafA/YrhL